MAAAGLLSLLHRTAFLAFVVGLLTVAGAVVLWVELLMREAAVYVIVLMLPLAFAAMVWPARRVWAIRAVELLVALILSKFAIVAVLSLGGAALGHTLRQRGHGTLAGFVLVCWRSFAPWALLRLLPLTELAGHAWRRCDADGRMALGQFETAVDKGAKASDWLALATEMSRELPAAEPPIANRRHVGVRPDERARRTHGGRGRDVGGRGRRGRRRHAQRCRAAGRTRARRRGLGRAGTGWPRFQPARASERGRRRPVTSAPTSEARPGGAQPGPSSHMRRPT